MLYYKVTGTEKGVINLNIHRLLLCFLFTLFPLVSFSPFAPCSLLHSVESLDSSLQLKTLSSPENFANLGKKTLTKMNRVIVNVVNKLKNIGQNVFMKRGKTPVDKTISTMAERLSVLDTQLDKTWNDLEVSVKSSEGFSFDLSRI